MKDIDFLPSWYKDDKRQQIGYRTQYIVLGTIFFIMLICNLTYTRAISKVRAELNKNELVVTEAESTSFRYATKKDEIDDLQKKAMVYSDIDSQIDVANVLAEISCLVDKQIVLSAVEITAERFSDSRTNKQGSAVRSASGGSYGNKVMYFGDLRYKILLSGIAFDGGHVAQLICKLESSSYFKKVYPIFSRNRSISPSKNDQNQFTVSEFEISCYLANYDESLVETH